MGKKNPGSAAQQPTTEYELKKCITVGSAEVLVIDYASKPDKQAYAVKVGKMEIPTTIKYILSINSLILSALGLSI